MNRQTNNQPNLYGILGVERTASHKEITMAYRKLARTWHPDKNQHRLREAEVRFQEINMANEILSDNQKRQTYDQFGFEAVNNVGQGAPGPMPDFLAQMFGGMGMGGPGRGGPGMGFHFTTGPGMHFHRARTDQFAPYQILQHQLPVTLADLYQGREIEFKIRKRVRKEVIRENPQAESKEPRTHITAVMEIVTQKFQVIPGMVYGQKYQMAGQGHYLNEERQFGNLIVVLMPAPNEPSKFKIKGSGQLNNHMDPLDLVYPLEISLKQALCGFSLPIIHLDGKIIVIESLGIHDLGGVNSSGQPVLRLESRKVVGLGMPALQVQNQPPNQRTKGDLYLELEVILPGSELLDCKELAKALPEMALDKKYTVKKDHQTYKLSEMELMTEKKNEEPAGSSNNVPPEGVECRTQ